MMMRCVPEAGTSAWPTGGRGGSGWCWASRSRGRAGGRRCRTTRALRDRIAEDLDGTFEELVRIYQDRLYSYALRLTARREDAEEVAQDAFVKAYRALATYPAESASGASRCAPWLYRITLNTARNRFRGKKLRTVSLDHPTRAGKRATCGSCRRSGGASRRAIREARRRSRQDIAGVMAGLPDRYRAAAAASLRRGAATGGGRDRAAAAARDDQVERASRNQRPARGSVGVPPGGGEVVTKMRESLTLLEGALGRSPQEKAPSTLLPAVLRRVGLADTYWRLESPVGPVFVAHSKAGISMVTRAKSAPTSSVRSTGATDARPIRRSRCLRRACARWSQNLKGEGGGSCGSTCGDSPSSSRRCC